MYNPKGSIWWCHLVTLWEHNIYDPHYYPWYLERNDFTPVYFPLGFIYNKYLLFKYINKDL